MHCFMQKLRILIIVFCIITVGIFHNNCTKDKGYLARRNFDIVDTLRGRISFNINGYQEERFYAQAYIHENKIRILGSKWEHTAVDGPAPFRKIRFCIGENTLVKQRVWPRQSLTASTGGVSHYDSSRSWSSFNTNEEVDAICEFFEVNEKDSLTNFIQITQEKNNFSEIWGIFRVTYLKTSGCSYPFYPDDLIVENGYFHVFVK